MKNDISIMHLQMQLHSFIFLAVARQARKLIVFCSVSQGSEMLLAASAGIFKNAAAEVFQVFEVGSDYCISS